MPLRLNHFYGPHHFSEIPTLVKALPSNGSIKVIYIWGFVYKIHNGVLGKVLDCTQPQNENFEGVNWKDHKFIPYYVGQANKKDPFYRLYSHKNPKSNTSKITRFDENYMRFFFYGKDKFPIHYKNDRSYNQKILAFVQKYPDSISYFNNHIVLEKIYRQKKKPRIRKITLNGLGNHWPIYEQQVDAKKMHEVAAAIDDRISADNFWFCFAILHNNVDKKYRDDAEAYTFWSLKGVTIGEISRSKTQIPLSCEKSCSYLFKNVQPNGDIHAIIPNHPPVADKTIFWGY